MFFLRICEIWSIKIFNLNFGQSSSSPFDVLPFDQISSDNCVSCEKGIKLRTPSFY